MASHKQEDELAQNIKKLEGKVVELNVRLEDKGRAGSTVCMFAVPLVVDVCTYVLCQDSICTNMHTCLYAPIDSHTLAEQWLVHMLQNYCYFSVDD